MLFLSALCGLFKSPFSNLVVNPLGYEPLQLNDNIKQTFISQGSKASVHRF